MTTPLVDEARSWDYVRETTANHGLRVNAIQIAAGGRDGDSWCMEFVWWCFDHLCKGKAPFEREQSVQQFRELATAKGWKVDRPLEGDLVVSVNAENHGHHIGIVSGLNPLCSIAGNTDETGTSSNGTGVFEHAIAIQGKEFFRVPLP